MTTTTCRRKASHSQLPPKLRCFSGGSTTERRLIKPSATSSPAPRCFAYSVRRGNELCDGAECCRHRRRQQITLRASRRWECQGKSRTRVSARCYCPGRG